jgi:FkbM family methyltransferase
MNKYKAFEWHYRTCEGDVLKYKNLLENKDIIDIGSNIGYFSLAVCKNVVPKSIHLFEPSMEYYTYSKELLKDYQNIYFNNYGLDNTSTRKILYKCPNENIGWNTFLEKDPNQADTFIQTMNTELCHLQMLDEYPIKNVDFIKIDVEGYETRVIEGGLKTIEKFRPYLFIEVGWGSNHPEWSQCEIVYNKLFDIGYEKVKFEGYTQDILFIPNAK